MVEMNPIPAVIAHRDALQEDLVDAMRQNAMAALLVPRQAQVLNRHPP
jgi:hypothetical protein